MKTSLRLLTIFCLIAIPLDFVADNFTAKHIIVKTENCKLPERKRVIGLENLYNDSIDVRLKNDFDNHVFNLTLASGAAWEDDKTCTVVFAKPKTQIGGKFIEILRFNNLVKQTPEVTTTTKSISTEKVVAEFLSVIDTDSVYSKTKIYEDSVAIMNHVENIRGWNDKKAYIKEKDIESFIRAQEEVTNDSTLISDFLKRYDKQQITVQKECIDSLRAILRERLILREGNMKPLKDEVEKIKNENTLTKPNWNLIGVCATSAVILIGLFLWYRSADRKEIKKIKKNTNSSSWETDSMIVIGERKTTTLKKQSLDDVYDNEAYIKIECKDFCTDSAVRAMYIKNTCIKDIYNMYAEDLRNPNNPKEDGCLVIGRWVLVAKTKEYDVSLEYIVTPGDDAIFSEYELNFGGKIQLKKGNMLKRLRRDTELQYDLTCWVHSHPGLGVFFSNSDNNVQMQLKNELHPRFLTAMVIDILTPEQDTGIFTFKKDDTINSKNDLTQMYSLEEMYKWAIDSERRSFNKDEYFNILNKADKRIYECYGIELSNGAIIDMTYLTTNSNGFVGLVHGYPIQQGEKMECIITSVTKNEVVSENEIIGCFVIAAHCSIPSIRKAVLPFLDRIRFVLVYTATDGIVTSIPVQNHDLCNNEEYYGEQLLEDLKVWTRRRR